MKVKLVTGVIAAGALEDAHSCVHCCAGDDVDRHVLPLIEIAVCTLLRPTVNVVTVHFEKKGQMQFLSLFTDIFWYIRCRPNDKLLYSKRVHIMHQCASRR